jgi:tyrosyl-tRNA synthetase
MPVDIDKDTVNDVIPQLIELEFVKSRSEFIRLIRQGGVRINGEKINEDDLNRTLANSDVIKVGKKKFLRIEKQ